MVTINKLTTIARTGRLINVAVFIVQTRPYIAVGGVVVGLDAGFESAALGFSTVIGAPSVTFCKPLEIIVSPALIPLKIMY